MHLNQGSDMHPRSLFKYFSDDNLMITVPIGIFEYTYQYYYISCLDNSYAEMVEL